MLPNFKFWLIYKHFPWRGLELSCLVNVKCSMLRKSCCTNTLQTDLSLKYISRFYFISPYMVISFQLCKNGFHQNSYRNYSCHIAVLLVYTQTWNIACHRERRTMDEIKLLLFLMSNLTSPINVQLLLNVKKINGEN